MIKQLRKEDAIKFLPHIFIVILVLFSYLSFFPGLNANDSLEQWRQTISQGEISNYHPPIMVYLWKFTQIFFNGPQGLHFVHCLIYWAGIFLIANYFSNRIWVRLSVIILIGLFPPTYVWSLHLLKDSGMFVSFILAVALILNYQKNQKVSYLYLATIFIFYGIAIRYNAIFAGFVLLYFNVKLICEHHQNSSFYKIYFSIIAAIIALIVCVNNIGTKHYNTLSTIQLWDLTAMSLDQNKVLLPRQVIKKSNLGDEEILKILKREFSPYNCVPSFLSSNMIDLWQEESYTKHFLKTVLAHPKSYLKHRLRTTKHLFNSRNGFYYASIRGNEIDNHRAKISKYEFIPRQYEEVFIMKLAKKMIRNTFLFNPLFYIILSLLIVPFVKRNSAAFYLLLSSLAFEAPLIFVAPANDYRYNIWMIFVSLISLVLVAKDKFKIR